MSGSYTLAEYETETYTYWTESDFTDGSWATTAGKTSEVSGGRSSTYQGCGDYELSGEDWYESGTITEIGEKASSYWRLTDSVLGTNGQWYAVSGTTVTEATVSSSWSYSGQRLYWNDELSGTYTVEGYESESYSYSTESNTAEGVTSTVGSRTRTVSGGDASSYEGSGSYDFVDENSVHISGTVQESGADEHCYQYIVEETLIADGQWWMVSGTGSSQGSGWATYEYSHAETFSGGEDYGTTSWSFESMLLETSERISTYEYETQAFVNSYGVWVWSGVSSSQGSGATSLSYSAAGEYSVTESDSWGDGESWSSYSATVEQQRFRDTWYSYSTTSELALDGSVITTTTATAAGNSGGSYNYSAEGESYDFSSWGNVWHGNGAEDESSETFTFSRNEVYASQFESNYTITSGSGGTSINGSATGSTEASGSATYNSQSESTSAEASTGSDYESWSEQSGQSQVATVDAYDFEEIWSRDYDGDATPTVTLSRTNNVTGSRDSSWSSEWAWGETWWEENPDCGCSDPECGPIMWTDGDAGSNSGNNSQSYDLTVAYSGFYLHAWFHGYHDAWPSDGDLGYWLDLTGRSSGAGFNQQEYGPGQFLNAGFAFSPTVQPSGSGGPTIYSADGDASPSDPDGDEMTIQSDGTVMQAAAGDGGGWWQSVAGFFGGVWDTLTSPFANLAVGAFEALKEIVFYFRDIGAGLLEAASHKLSNGGQWFTPLKFDDWSATARNNPVTNPNFGKDAWLNALEWGAFAGTAGIYGIGKALWYFWETNDAAGAQKQLGGVAGVNLTFAAQIKAVQVVRGAGRSRGGENVETPVEGGSTIKPVIIELPMDLFGPDPFPARPPAFPPWMRPPVPPDPPPLYGDLPPRWRPPRPPGDFPPPPFSSN